jgi:ribosomal protein S5
MDKKIPTQEEIDSVQAFLADKAKVEKKAKFVNGMASAAGAGVYVGIFVGVVTLCVGVANVVVNAIGGNTNSNNQS